MHRLQHHLHFLCRDFQPISSETLSRAEDSLLIVLSCDAVLPRDGTAAVPSDKSSHHAASRVGEEGMHLIIRTRSLIIKIGDRNG